MRGHFKQGGAYKGKGPKRGKAQKGERAKKASAQKGRRQKAGIPAVSEEKHTTMVTPTGIEPVFQP